MTRISELLDQDCPRLPDIIVKAAALPPDGTRSGQVTLIFNTRRDLLTDAPGKKVPTGVLPRMYERGSLIDRLASANLPKRFTSIIERI
jgi:hypothetical protein